MGNLFFIIVINGVTFQERAQIIITYASIRYFSPLCHLSPGCYESRFMDEEESSSPTTQLSFQLCLILEEVSGHDLMRLGKAFLGELGCE